MNQETGQLKSRQHRLELKAHDPQNLSLLEAAPDPILIHSQNKIVYVNEAFVKEWGLTDKDQLASPFIDPFIRDIHDIRNLALLYQGEPISSQYTKAARLDGTVMDLEYFGMPILYEGDPAALILARNVTEQFHLYQELLSTQGQLHQILNNLDAGIWAYDISKSQMVTYSERLKQFIGSLPGEASPLFELWSKFNPAEDRAKFEQLEQTLFKDGVYSNNVAYTRPDGSVVHFNYRVSTVKDVEGRIIRLDGMLIDITEQVNAAEKVKQLAYHDELTGLPNRRFFKQRLDETLAAAKQNGEMAALVYMDLDRFKQINDSMGHLAGDWLLKETADRLASATAGSDGFVSRLAGDEFTVILAGFHTLPRLERQIERILENFREPVDIEGYTFFIKASLGVAVFPQHASTVESLMNCADSAMLMAKETRNTYRFYNSDMESSTNLEDIRLQNDLQKVLLQDELTLHYQSKHQIPSGKIIGSEALLRWDHPELGMISPMRFIPLAEDIGLINDIGNWVIHKVCGQIKEWSNRGIHHPVSINLSVRQFQHGQITEVIRQSLAQYQIDPGLLELEITESIAMDIDKVLGILTELNKLGVLISIDDFGTGYSSLSYLKRLPVHKLKIDRSFIQELHTDQGDKAIVSTIVALAHNMQLKVTAEGVETDEQLRILEGFQCDEVQGYYFNKPLPLEQFEMLLEPGQLENVKISRASSAKVKGKFCKFVFDSLLIGDKKFPEYRALIEEMEEQEWYSWDFYVNMLQEISRRVNTSAMKEAGKNIIRNAKDYHTEEMGIRSLEQILISFREEFDRTVVGLPEHERAKVVLYEPGRFILHFTARQPLSFTEGVICGFFELFETEITSIQGRKVDDFYYEYEVTWLPTAPHGESDRR